MKLITCLVVQIWGVSGVVVKHGVEVRGSRELIHAYTDFRQPPQWYCTLWQRSVLSWANWLCWDRPSVSTHNELIVLLPILKLVPGKSIRLGCLTLPCVTQWRWR